MDLFGKKKSSFAADSKKALHKHLGFAASEQYRLLRTNIMFTLPEGVKCPIIGVTSSSRSEGKSITSINLSYTLAEQGSRVLLIDGDLRLPTVAKKMGIDNAPGLSNLLLGGGADIVDWQSSVQKNWYILPAGNIPPNPSELLGSSRMEKVLNTLKESFDYIIVDFPPVNIVSDAMSIAKMLTGIIVVVRENYTTKQELEQCIRQIKLSGANILGCVMNDSGSDEGSYSKYGKYKYGKYKYYSQPSEE